MPRRCPVRSQDARRPAAWATARARRGRAARAQPGRVEVEVEVERIEVEVEVERIEVEVEHQGADLVEVEVGTALPKTGDERSEAGDRL